MAKRASASSSSGQPSQPKRPCPAPTDQTRHQSESNLVPRSWLTEEDARRVFREEVERIVSNWAESFQRQFREKAEQILSNWAESFQSYWGNALEEMMQKISSIENAVRKPEETVELANSQSLHLGGGNAISTLKNGARNLQLQFRTKLPDSLFTGNKLEGEGGAHISIALTDANTREVVTSDLESSIKLDVVVLEGDFDKDNEDDWTQEEFESYIIKGRKRKGQLLVGDLVVKLKGGVGQLGELRFTDISSKNESGTFRIGLKVASDYCGNTRIREAKSDAFRVKVHRGELSKKHDLPAFDDEVWRLKMIARDGTYHQRLSKAGICKVGDFLLQLSTDAIKLKEILGMSSNLKRWDILQNHAKSCKTNWKLYTYYPDGVGMPGAVFNADCQLIGLIKDRMCYSAHRLSSAEKEHGDRIVKEAIHKCSNGGQLNAETFSGSMQKKSLIDFPSQVLEGQIENLTPVQCNLVPPVCAPSGGPEAPPEIAGFTAEGNNGAGALALPVQLQNTNSGNAMKLSVDNLNVLIPQGYNSIPTVGLPIQSHGNNTEYAIHSHMIHSSRQMDYTVNENFPLSEPPPATIFPYSSTPPHPQGNHVTEDFEPNNLDDLWAMLEDRPHDFDMFPRVPCDVASVSGTGKGVGVVGWLVIKAVMRWGIFKMRRARKLQLVQI